MQILYIIYVLQAKKIQNPDEEEVEVEKDMEFNANSDGMSKQIRFLCNTSFDSLGVHKYLSILYMYVCIG